MTTPDEFATICYAKDDNPRNLNEIFEKHGCHTLESNAPVVDQDSVERMKEIDHEQATYGMLVIKNRAARNAIEHRASRTRNRSLELLELNGQSIISAGQERERSPVDRDTLELELDDYMAETRRIRAQAGQKFYPDMSDEHIIRNSNGCSAPGFSVDVEMVKEEVKPRLTSNPFKNFAKPNQVSPARAPKVTPPSKVTRVTNNGLRRAKGLERARSLIAKTTPSPIPSCKDLDDDLDAYLAEGMKLKEKDQTLSAIETQREMMEECDLIWG